jgi:hypothetical protein
MHLSFNASVFRLMAVVETVSGLLGIVALCSRRTLLDGSELAEHTHLGSYQSFIFKAAPALAEPIFYRRRVTHSGTRALVCCLLRRIESSSPSVIGG